MKRLCLFVAMSAVCGWAPRADAEEVEPPRVLELEGGGETGPLRLWRLDGSSALFRDDMNRERTLRLSEILRCGNFVDPVDADQVLLMDRSLLLGSVLSINREEIVLQNDIWGEVVLPRRVVVAIVWQPPAERLERWRLRDRLWARAAAGSLTLSNGDQLAGRLEEAGDGELSYSSAGGKLSLPVDLVSSWRSADVTPLENVTSANASLVGMQDGSWLSAQSLSLGNELRVRLVCGVALTSLPEIRVVEEGWLSFLRPANSAVTYLSDLTPLGHKHIPLLSVQWPWRADRNVLGGPMSAVGRLYAKGVGMHSTSRLAYELDQPYDEFQAELAVDSSSGQRGSITFRVFKTDGQGDWQLAYKSDIVRGGMAPVPLRVDVQGAKRLALVVDFADWGDQLDRANWIDARLIRKGAPEK